MEKHSRIAGVLIVAGVAALPVLAVIAVPHVEQGWQKRGATVEQFGDTDRNCTAQQSDPALNLSEPEKKLRHDACMRASGWAPL